MSEQLRSLLAETFNRDYQIAEVSVRHSEHSRALNCSKDMIKSLVKLLGYATTWACCFAGYSSELEEASSRSNYDAIKLIARNLYDALPAAQRGLIHSDPVVLQDGYAPIVKPSEFAFGKELCSVVIVSEGFVDLINNISCARAQSLFLNGFFETYSANLSRETGDTKIHELPALAHRNSWSVRMSNEQLTSFNQMAGTLLAIDLAHHYLGHYRRYRDKLTDEQGNAVPINSLLTSSEWDAALTVGTINALDCGLATDGLKSLFQFIDRMPQRPSWTIYLLPANAKVQQINKKLTKLERSFFIGRH